MLTDDWRKSILVPVYKGKGDNKNQVLQIKVCLNSLFESIKGQ